MADREREDTREKPVEAPGDMPVEKVQHAARAETTPAPVRRSRAVWFEASVLAAIIAFSVLAFLVSTTPFFPVDVQITLALQSIPFAPFGIFMELLSWPGFAPQTFVVVALIVAVVYALGLRWEAVVALFAAIVDSAVNVLIKSVIHRVRPGADVVHVVEALNSYSFPSGHVMFYTAFFGFLWFLAFTLLKPSWKRKLLLLTFGGLVVLIGFSRIYLGQHWASDVVGAYLLGSLVLVGTIAVYRWGKPRFFVSQPVAAEHT
jgi:membrane-associated phospholipid phosphatase